MGFQHFLGCLNLEYSDLNRNGPHRSTCVNAWPIGRGTLRRCGLVGEEVCRCGSSFEVPLAQAMFTVAQSFLLPMDQDIEPSAPFPVRLPACCHVLLS